MPAPANPLVALVDCNNFYASCERVFAPALEGKPVVILSNNDGCIVARSEEAKKLGVPMGEPFFSWEHRFRQHRIQVFSSNYTLYADMSRRVMEVLAQFTPEQEIYSIDEAFLGLSCCGQQTSAAYAAQIRATVKQWTGIPVSIGIAETKTLAKLANRKAKKTPASGGVMALLDAAAREAALAETPVEDVWGIGPAHSRKLRHHGILSALHLRDACPRWLQRNLSVVGVRIARELRGIACLTLDNCPSSKKTICSSRSFGRPVIGVDELREALVTYTSRAAQKLREEGSCAQGLAVFVATSAFTPAPYYSNSAGMKLPTPTDDTAELIHYALLGLESVYRPLLEYKKAGVLLLDLIPRERVQPDLFPDSNRQRRRQLMGVIDGLNQRLGAETLRYLGTGMRREWGMRRRQVSPRYTTHWDELPLARA